MRRHPVRGDGDGHALAGVPHVPDERRDVGAHEVRPQRPRGVDVADGHRDVGCAGEHEAPVGEGLLDREGLPVDGELDATQRLEQQPGRRDDDVRLHDPAVGEADPLGDEAVDVAGDDVGAAAPDRGVEVAVGHGAQALVPDVVRRGEVLLDDVRGQVPPELGEDELVGGLRADPGELVEEGLHAEVLHPGHGLDRLRAEPATQRLDEGVDPRQREDIARRALEHRHVLRGLGHRGHDRHRGRPGADDDDPLARVVEVLRPELRVDHLPGEVLDPLEARVVRLLVVVVPAAEVDEAGPDLPATARGLQLDGPLLLVRGPARGDDPVPGVDALGQSALAGRLPDVLEDVAAVGDRLAALPRTEGEGQGEHVGVGAHPGVAEEVPGPAGRLPRLDDRQLDAGVRLLDAVRGADAREPGADDEDVDALRQLVGRGGVIGCKGHVRPSVWDVSPR